MVDLLVPNIDQGSSGMAACYYAGGEMQAFIWPHFCKVHRKIRNQKLALASTSNKWAYKAQVVSSFIFSLNYKPNNAGTWQEEKCAKMNHVLTTCNGDSPVVRKYAGLIGDSVLQRHTIRCTKTNIMPTSTREASWQSVPSALNRFP